MALILGPITFTILVSIGLGLLIHILRPRPWSRWWSLAGVIVAWLLIIYGVAVFLANVVFKASA